MNPYDPTQPQPGDWEAALTAIEAAEAHADAVHRWRKWGGWGAAAAVATMVLWFGVRSEEASSPSPAANTTIEQPTQAEAFVSVESNQQAADDSHSTTLETPAFNQGEWAPTAEQVAPTHSEPQPGRKQQPVASSFDDLPATGDEHVLQQSFKADAEATPSPGISSENLMAEAIDFPFTQGEVGARSATVQPEQPFGELATAGSDLRGLTPRNPTLTRRGAAGPTFQAMSVTEAARPPHAWGALVSWEGGEWAAALTRELQGGWFVRLGGVWDGRHRKWVATPARDVFGALQAPRSVLSDQAIWASGGMEYRHHIKGRWGAVGRVDAQYLLARHLVEGQWGGGEQIVAGNAAAWGQLNEETPWRLGWGAGCDWSVSEAHALRMTVGGYWSPTPTYDYIDWIEGLPRAAGELRLTWLWK